MLGRKSFAADELRAARALVDRQLEMWDRLGGSADAETEQAYFASALLALDRFFVHRLRMVTGKGGTPLNEVELLVEALLHHDGVLATDNVIKYVAAESVVGIHPGDTVALDRGSYAALADGCFAELEQKYAEKEPAAV
jgi:hypothetical protein